MNSVELMELYCTNWFGGMTNPDALQTHRKK